LQYIWWLSSFGAFSRHRYQEQSNRRIFGLVISREQVITAERPENMENGVRTLIVPGLNGSGPDHWQSLWEKKYGFERVEQLDWENPDAIGWAQNLNMAILKYSEKVVVVAHSLGCFTVIRWVKQYADFAERVQSALLVAPPDISSMAIPESVKAFALHNPVKLPFPSILVGSENDPYMTLKVARDLALALGSRFVNAGLVGHINIDSGHGPWPQGEVLFQELTPGNFKKKEKCKGFFHTNYFQSIIRERSNS
jgi:uncharacterized protein